VVFLNCVTLVNFAVTGALGYTVEASITKILLLLFISFSKKLSCVHIWKLFSYIIDIIKNPDRYKKVGK